MVDRFFSIRTRYSVVTAVLLFLALVTFYVGGRLVLKHVTIDASAVNYLTAVVAVAGILLVFPIFWIQSRILLNPLTRMTEAICSLVLRHNEADCPRLSWRGRDEFAQLASSVNRLLEMLSARAVAVAQIEARHQALINGVPDALAIFDISGQLVSITKQPEAVSPLIGFSEGEMLKTSVFGASGVKAFADALAWTFRTGGIGKANLTEEPLAGEGAEGQEPSLRRSFELRLTKMDEHFALVIVRDTTAEREEHKLRLAAESRANDVKKRESLTLLAAGIAHDMNNVLSVVLSAAESADADPSGDSAHALETIRDAVRRGSSMMRELRTYAGESRMSFMRMSPEMILDDIRMLAEELVSSNIILSFNPGVGIQDVDADPNQLWKVFFNIVKNANEAIGSQPGHISLSAMPFEMTRGEATNFISEHPLQPGPGVIFRIDDDGPGIAADLLPRLFDPYVSSRAIGRGLGLATVRTIVEAHGGGLCVRSQPERGTTFFIYLPESRLPKKGVDGAPEASAEVASGEVLVVDNDEAILKTMSILLRALKMSPFLAHDRREALAIVRRHAETLKIIVLDANLGRVDTVRLMEAFRLGAPNVPVVVSSGSPEEEMEKLFRPHPYDAFLAKPYTMQELKTLLAKFSKI